MVFRNNSIAHWYFLWKPLEHNRGFWERFQQGKREKEKGYFAIVFFSDQQYSNRVSRLTNRWIMQKFGLSDPYILVVDLNVGDIIRRSARSCFRSRTETEFDWCFFLFTFCCCSYCLFFFGTCSVAIRGIFLTLLYV